MLPLKDLFQVFSTCQVSRGNLKVLTAAFALLELPKEATASWTATRQVLGSSFWEQLEKFDPREAKAKFAWEEIEATLGGM